MKKILLIGVLILAIVASVLTGTLAVYSVSLDEISGDMVAKEFAVSAEGKWDYTNPIKLAPGESATIGFTITNKDGNIVSEVPMDVTIKSGLKQIAATGTTEAKEINPHITYVIKNEYDEELGSFDGGIGEINSTFHMGVSATETVRAFSITLKWESHEDDIDYLNAGNKVYINISATQCTNSEHVDEMYFNAAGYNGGEGTAAKPYIIATRNAFLNITNAPEGTYFVLDRDLNLGVLESKETRLFKNYVVDGQGHSLELISKRPIYDRLDGGTIENLTVKNFYFDGIPDKTVKNNNMAIFSEVVSSEQGEVVFRNIHMVDCTMTVRNGSMVGFFTSRLYAHKQITFDNCSLQGCRIDSFNPNRPSAGMFSATASRENLNEDSFVLFNNCFICDSATRRSIIYCASGENNANNLTKLANSTSNPGQGINGLDVAYVIQIHFDGMEGNDYKDKYGNNDKAWGLEYRTIENTLLFDVDRAYGDYDNYTSIPVVQGNFPMNFSYDEFMSAHNPYYVAEE